MNRQDAIALSASVQGRSCTAQQSAMGNLPERLVAHDLHTATARNAGLELRLDLHKDQASKKRETHARKSTDKKVLREVPLLIVFYLWVTGECLCGNQQADALRITGD